MLLPLSCLPFSQTAKKHSQSKLGTITHSSFLQEGTNRLEVIHIILTRSIKLFKISSVELQERMQLCQLLNLMIITSIKSKQNQYTVYLILLEIFLIISQMQMLVLFFPLFPASHNQSVAYQVLEVTTTLHILLLIGNRSFLHQNHNLNKQEYQLRKKLMLGNNHSFNQKML